MTEDRIAALEEALEWARMEAQVMRECATKIREMAVRMGFQVVAQSKVYCEEIKPLLENQEVLEAAIRRRLKDKQSREDEVLREWEKEGESVDPSTAS